MCTLGAKERMANWGMEVGGEYYALPFASKRKARNIGTTENLAIALIKPVVCSLKCCWKQLHRIPTP